MLARPSWILLLLACLSSPPGLAPGQSLEGGARAVSLGGAATALPGDPWGHGNPATWAGAPMRSLSFFASEAYGLSELRLGAVQAVIPLSFGTLAAGARTFGFESFRATHFEVGYARGLALGTTRHFLVGLRLRYHQVTIDGYGSGSTLGLSAGWLVEVFPALYAGAQGTNLNTPRLGGREALERTLSLGLAYRPAEGLLLLLLDALKDVRFPLSLRGGVEMLPVRALALRAGATTHPTRFTAGVGVRLPPLSADVAGEYHEVLGWSPALSLSLSW